MRRVGIRPVTGEDSPALDGLDAEQTQVELQRALAKIEQQGRMLAEQEAQIARHRAAQSEVRSERDRAKAGADALRLRAEKAERERDAAQDRVQTGAVVERAWASLSPDDLIAWVNRHKGGRPFSGKGALARAQAWCFTMGDLACFELWAKGSG